MIPTSGARLGCTSRTRKVQTTYNFNCFNIYGHGIYGIVGLEYTRVYWSATRHVYIKP